MRLIRLAACALLSIAVLCGADPLRIVDGVPLGGPPHVAAAVDWVVQHATGRNREHFAEAVGQRATYALWLVDRGQIPVWADAFQIQAEGRLPVHVVVLGDAAAGRNHATVDLWYEAKDGRRAAKWFSLQRSSSADAWTATAQRQNDDEDPKRLPTLEGLRVDTLPGVVVQRDEAGQVLEDPWGWMVFDDAAGRSLIANNAISAGLLQATVGEAAGGDGPFVFTFLGGLSPVQPGIAMATRNLDADVRGRYRLFAAEIHKGSARSLQAPTVCQIAVTAGGDSQFTTAAVVLEGGGWTLGARKTVMRGKHPVVKIGKP